MISSRGWARTATFPGNAGWVSIMNSAAARSSGAGVVGTMWQNSAWTIPVPASSVPRYSAMLIPSANQNSSASKGTTQSAPPRHAWCASQVIFSDW